MTNPEIQPANPPRHVGNPTGSRKANLAKTYPPAPTTKLLHSGKRPTKEQYDAMMAHFRAHPETRTKVGQRSALDSNLVFLGYRQNAPDGERWGTKQQLVDQRRRSNLWSAKWRRRKMETDPEYRAARFADLAKIVARAKAIREAEADPNPNPRRSRLSTGKRTKKEKRRARATYRKNKAARAAMKESC